MKSTGKKRRSGAKGFTLFEVLVAFFLSMLAFTAVLMVIASAQQSFRTSDLYSRLNQSAMQTLRSISREIGQTSPNISPSHISITTDGSNNSVVRFQIPVDWDNDGDAVTGSMNPQVEWGAYDQPGDHQNGRLGAWTQYLVQNNQLVRNVLDSSLTQIQGQTRVVANNVQSFTVVKNLNRLRMTLTVLTSDTVGQKGAQVRNLQQTFIAETLLRNAVN